MAVSPYFRVKAFCLLWAHPRSFLILGLKLIYEIYNISPKIEPESGLCNAYFVSDG